jgi:hypothetical protein
MKSLPAIVCAVLALGEPACSIGPATTDGGTTGTATSTSTVGDQCDQVATDYCENAINRCAQDIALTDCISGEESLCCTGSACDALSTVSDDTVTACEGTFDSEDCYPLTQMTAASCLQ